MKKVFLRDLTQCCWYCSGRNGRNISYWYANWYEIPPIPPWVQFRVVLDHSSCSSQFQWIPPKISNSASTQINKLYFLGFLTLKRCLLRLFFLLYLFLFFSAASSFFFSPTTSFSSPFFAFAAPTPIPFPYFYFIYFLFYVPIIPSAHLLFMSQYLVHSNWLLTFQIFNNFTILIL